MTTSYFRESRNIELSVIYYLETCLAADWSGVTVVKAFTNAYKTALPVVSVELNNTQNNWKEIGSTSLNNDYTFNIDVFATSDAQSSDIADYLVDKLKDGCVYYSHSQTSGAPETLSRVSDGRVFTVRFDANYKIDLGDYGVDRYDQHRRLITITVKKSH